MVKWEANKWTATVLAGGRKLYLVVEHCPGTSWLFTWHWRVVAEDGSVARSGSNTMMGPAKASCSLAAKAVIRERSTEAYVRSHR
jgi:hypothetical protein